MGWFARVGGGCIGAAPDAVAGGEQHLVRIKRVDHDGAHPMRVAALNVRRAGTVPLGVVVPQLRPARAAVGAAVNFIVRGPVGERRGHEGLRMLRIHCDATIAEMLVGIGRVDRRDVSPSAVFGVEFPNRAVAHLIGSGFLAIGQIKYSVRRRYDVIGAQPHRLVRDGQPGAAGIGAAKKIRSGRGRRRVKHGGRTAGFAAGGVKHHAHYADRLLGKTPTEIRICAGRGRRRPVGGNDVGKTFNLLPRRSPVSALPQAVPPRAEENYFALVRIYGQPLAVEPAGLVAAHSEGQVGPPEGSPLVIRTKNGPVDPATVGAGGQINALRIAGIHGEAVNPHQVRIGHAQPIGDGNPPLRRFIPAVGAAHVGARIHQTFLARMRNDAGDESAAAHDHVAPDIRF